MRNRITLAMRPLVVRGARTMIIDAGLGDKDDAKFHEIYGVDRAPAPRSRARRGGRRARGHRHRARHATCTSITPAASPSATPTAASRPRFPRAQYVVRRGEWEDATHPHERNRASYLAGQLRAARRGRRAAARGRRPDDHAGRAGAADRRPHDAPSDRLIESGGQTRGVRRRSDADDARTCRTRGSWASTSIRWTRWPRSSAFVQRSDRAEDAGVLRARPGRRRRLHHASSDGKRPVVADTDQQHDEHAT